MNTLLVLHIAFMVTSIIATLGSTAASMLSTVVSKRFTAANIVVTTLGIISGGVLLLGAPLGAKCAALLAYLVAFVALQLFVVRRNQRLATSPDS